MSKILTQMQRNYYYLKIIPKQIYIFEYIENDGLYCYDPDSQLCNKCDIDYLVEIIKNQATDFSVDPDTIFTPSQFLISPFNSTAKFINGDYFLTTQQEKIKDEILTELDNYQMAFFTLSANAGTGKTLLLYDIAKEFIEENRNVKIIHCGKLNEGHYKLKDRYKWDIFPISSFSKQMDVPSAIRIIYGSSVIFVDESQRIRSPQLVSLITAAEKLRIPMIFSFDTKQYLRNGETLDLSQYLSTNYSNIPCLQKKLTNKIRTNKAMASFINNFMEIGKSKDNLDYSSISIDYFSESKDLSEYIGHLKKQGWKFITFTTSLCNPELDPYNKLRAYSETNAHDVIGQEFSKVAFVMDGNFKYENGKLKARSSYYSANGMLYQIVTRVVDELKILVWDNPDLYYHLLMIKKMGDN